MGYGAWPDADAVEAALGTVTVPDYIDLDAEIESAIAELERVTGYKPFLAEDTDNDERFSNWMPSGTQIQFPTGYASVTEFYVDATEDDNGTLLEYGTDYVHAPVAGETPIEGVTLFQPRRFSPFSLRIVGKRGFAATIPADVYRAVLEKASLSSLVVAENATGGTSISMIKQGPVTIEYSEGSSSGGYGGRCGEIEARWKAVLSKYMRATL
ncbi:MAG: hypothetical protein JNK63_02475 [Chthonomonas sp.]|nr:hypothetical protein [Chthonomonas sp.]